MPSKPEETGKMIISCPRCGNKYEMPYKLFNFDCSCGWRLIRLDEENKKAVIIGDEITFSN